MKTIRETSFKGMHRGKPTALFTLMNKNGVVVQVTNFGAKIVSIHVPDKHGQFGDIVLGYDSIDQYISGNPFFGAICGRYANRIANGKFTIDGREYQLPVNNGPNSLHGGPDGFNEQVFTAQEVAPSLFGQAIEMCYDSADGEMGYPGALKLNVTYRLTDQNELCIEYDAVTTADTVVNICSHSFFNLAGQGSGDILSHELQINAKTYTPVNDFLVPTGEFRPVRDTPMDFTKPCAIGKRIDEAYEQLRYGNGYDHNWVLDKNPGELGWAACCIDPVSGRKMDVYTTQPGIQLYTANWLNGTDSGKSGKIYQQRSALCLETQHFPDSPNKPEFPPTRLKPGEKYSNSCIYKFSTVR